MDRISPDLDISITETELKHGCYRLSAQNGKQEIGHVYCYLIVNDLHPTPYALVEDLAVSEAYRGKGVARMLMGALQQRAKKEHCYKVVANSHEKRDAARALYLSLGYRPHATEFRLDLA